VLCKVHLAPQTATAMQAAIAARTEILEHPTSVHHPLDVATATRTMPILGAHQSIAGGYYKAVEIAERTSCECVQVFTHRLPH
jgi:hypothetical protein